MKIKNLHITQFGILKDFDIDFTFENQCQNLIVVAGINGSGKTTLFEFISNYFSNESTNQAGDIELQESEKIQNKLIYFRANEQRIENANKTIVEYIEKLIFEDKLSPVDAYAATNNILSDLFSDFNLQLHFKGLDRKKQVSFINQNNKELTINELSSGERELLTKIFSMYLADIKDSLVMIDEPENSLHPLWQNRIATVYQKFAKKNDNQIILATHSPQIVGSVKKEQVRVLVNENNKIKVIDKFDGSYGWQVEKILLEIFRTNEVRTVEIEDKIQTLHNLIVSNQYNTIECTELFAEMENILGYDDNDLVLLRVELAKRTRQNEKNR